MDAKRKPNKEQQAAIDAEKNTVVAAGAGSGKTTVLSQRFLNLIRTKKDCHVDEILTLTFTKKATVEMSDRIYKVLKEEAPEEAANFNKANIKTLDSYCNSVAKLGCRYYGISPDFTQDKDGITAMVEEMALPFILEHRDEFAIKTMIEQFNSLQAVASDLFVNPVMNHSSVCEPIDFEGDFIKQRKKVVELWNKDVKSVCDEICKMIDFEETFEGNRKTQFYIALQKLKTEKKIPFEETITFEQLQNGNYKEALSSLKEYNSFNFPKAGSTKGTEKYKASLNNFCNALTELNFLGNYISGIPVVNELLPLLNEFQEKVNLLKRTTGILTFKDISNMALCTLRDYPEIRLEEKKKYKAIMIDEFQDNNEDQRNMLFLLAEKLERMEKSIPSAEELCEDKLFFVGDEKQSIYRFRGADVQVFNNLRKDFADGNLSMSTNYRSNAALIGAFNTIFGAIPYPLSKTEKIFDGAVPSVFFPEQIAEKRKDTDDEVPAYEAVYHEVLVPEHKRNQNVNDKKVFVALYDNNTAAEKNQLTNEAAEAEWVARKIEELMKNGVNPSDIAILMQKYNFQYLFERAFLQHNIPYNSESVTGFFSDGPVSDMVAYLTICAYENDTMAYYQVLCSPFVNLTVNEAAAVVNQGLPFFAEEGVKVLSEVSAIRYKHAAEFFASVKESCKEQNLARTVSKLWYEGGYRIETMWNHTVEMYGKLYDLLFELARKADENNENIASFVDNISSYKTGRGKLDDVTIPLEKAEGVHIMSIHKSKGLEFKVVFVCSTHSGIGSMKNDSITYYDPEYGISINTKVEFGEKKGGGNYFFIKAKNLTLKKQTAEFRRLSYVALTRAEEELYIVNAKYKVPSKGFKTSPLDGGNILNVYDTLAPVIEYYKNEENAAGSPFASIEYIPAYDRENNSSEGTNRRNNETGRLSLINLLSNDSPYDKAEVFEKEIVPEKYVSPSKLYHEEQTDDKDASDGKYPEINKVISKHSQFGHNNFGTIAHAYLEAEICGINTETTPPYSNRDISGLEDDKDSLKIVEGVCQKMQKSFAESELGKEAISSNWHKAEYVFRSFVAGKIVKGSIDLLFEKASGEYVIVDYKTNQSVKPEIYYCQLACYRQAVAKMMNVKPENIKCFLYYLRFDQAVDITKACSEVNIEEAVKTIE